MKTQYFILIAGDNWNNHVKNSVDHDSMSGEQVGIAFGLMITSGKSEVWPLMAPENRGLGKMRKSPKEGKDLGKKKMDK